MFSLTASIQVPLCYKYFLVERGGQGGGAARGFYLFYQLKGVLINVEIPDQKPQIGLQSSNVYLLHLTQSEMEVGRKGPLLTQKMSLKVRNNILRISGLYFTYWYGIRHLNT